MAIAVTIVLAIVALAIAFCLLTSPAVKINGWQELDTHKLERVRHAVTVMDRDGNTLAENFYANNRIYTPLAQVPQETIDAFVSIEDKRFYSHHGIDYVRMLGALKNNIFSASLKEGASTITQQLVKNTHLSGEKTFARKFQEIRIAKQLEKTYDKDTILETYLNVIYFGNNIYGIGQAARSYFGKDVSQLTVAEGALLAGIINNPSRFNPVTHPEQATKRRNIVLQSMCNNGKLDDEATASAKAEDLTICMDTQANAYATYLQCVIDEAAKALDCLPEELFERNCKIIVNAKCDQFNAIYNGMSDILYKDATSSRAIIVENTTGRILFDASNVHNAHELLRQPGSAIKPFVAYAPALEKKAVFPVSVIQDEKTDFNGYSPKNFNDKYYGDITVADSLKYSLNVPAVKLTDMCGIPYAKNVAARFGIVFSEQDTGLAIALGGLHDGITLQSLTDAYTTLANGGIYRKSRYVHSIYAQDTCLYAATEPNGRRAVGEDTAFLLTDMLQQCAMSGTAKRLHGFNNVAAKTGTVERGDYNSDAYCVAYTPNYTVAVWYGCDSQDQKIYGGQQPTVLAGKILRLLQDNAQFQAPESVERLDIDSKKLIEEKAVYLATPSLAKRYCSSVYFSKRNLPKKFSYGDNIPPLFDPFVTDLDNFEIFDRIAQ